MKKKFFMTGILSLFLFVAVQADTIEVATSCGEVYYTCGGCYDSIEELIEDVLYMDEILCD